jgi:type IV secretory pathway VirB2 component (pilin)
VHNHISIRSALIALIAAATFVFTAAPARAESAGSEYGIGFTCALGNLIYGPVKIIYATGGAIVSGFAWAFSAGDMDVVEPVWDASMRGDYVIEPDHLRGRKPLAFIGRSPEQARVMESESRSEVYDEGF